MILHLKIGNNPTNVTFLVGFQVSIIMIFHHVYGDIYTIYLWFILQHQANQNSKKR